MSVWFNTQCRLAAQLARTEEAAKRLMVRSDRSAQGGTAARLLAAEKELSCITASAVEMRGAPIHQPTLLRVVPHPFPPIQHSLSKPQTHRGSRMMPKKPYLVPGLAQRSGNVT